MRLAAGFALIELLIAVAILAVLAAVAAPNFMEAQARASVVRTKNDIRSVCVALESYMVDTNRYPAPRIAYVSGGEGIQSCSSLTYVMELSTPIAYLTTVSHLIDTLAPRNPWYSPSAKWGAFSKHEMSFQYSNFDPQYGVWGRGRLAESSQSKLWVAACVSGCGPSRRRDVWPEWSVFEYYGYHPPYIMIPFGTQQDPAARDTAWGMIYDATNGTISRGGIFRFVGALKTPNQ